ncbi:hypothetical protein M407DRAFT_216755 [Tulasnella calospora MUT 4182]|uniref:F-box domain-containing protein n=1 Tax=Tulasnella calospora MUT 4182 TaxID=1051891 RepID=A0A0C3Q1U3_9AGAM|nr:hypothetical protein M407DRAFT_216755 [Tulasnella calospora MUT 4182]
MQEINPIIGLDKIHRSLLVGLQEESQRNPQLGATSVLSNSSDAPLRSVQDLDKRIEFAEQSLKEAYLLLISHVTAAKRRRNALLPISKLPTEILGAILEMTYDLDSCQERSTDQRPSHTEHLLTFAAVSSQFFSAVMGTATLWAVADWRCSPSQVKRCLERSRGALLAVKYHSRGESTTKRTMVPTRGVDSLISEHIARWRDADLVLDSEKDLKTLSKWAAPQLRRIAIDYIDIDETLGKPIHLFGGNAPNLTIIDLRGIHVHWEWDPNMIANLRSLVLQGVLISKASVGSFLSSIQSFSTLQKLVIRHVQLDDAADLIPVSPSWLNSLKELEIRGVAKDVFRYLLGTIRAPHVQNVTVDSPFYWDTEDWGQLLLRYLDNSILQDVEQALHVELSFSDRGARISLFTGLGPPLVLNLDGDEVNPDAMEWLLENIVADRKRSTLGIRLSGNYPATARNIGPLWLRLHGVTKLELESNGHGPPIPPAFFSRPTSMAGEEQWVWPRLTSVIVNGRGWESAGQDILAIVKGRLAGSSVACETEDAGEHKDRGRPAPIQTVHMPNIMCLSESTAGQLKNLVPDIRLPEEILSPFIQLETPYYSSHETP